MEEENSWIRVTATAKHEDLDTLCAVMGMVANGLEIEDYSDIEQCVAESVYKELADASLFERDRTVASVSVYLPAEAPLGETLLYLKERFAALNVDAKLTETSLNEEDWAESWKQYYKPVEIGKKLVIVPMWETYDEKDRIAVRMDPGMAFGTGTHETTRLSALLLEEETVAGCTMLDVGCGSGILAICASKLGAGECYAYDIDPVAVRVAEENVRDNGVSNVVCGVSDLLAGVRPGTYRVITANIVADIILRLLPDVGKFMDKDSVLILSGIIEDRLGEIYKALEKYGFAVIGGAKENDWCAVKARLAK